ncbi:uncharacterized protein LOC126833443 isoform X2 [Adelges cooleyi]|uniref:uncharacterized protein LOC126833443 isoform X2 n=1 Tax=Adelges cooleyi TaxID=133065 RepID=UPI00217F23A0|nr:uncharacterized protein LOC126833443 isoform X2 [Adelges cooleyi]
MANTAMVQPVRRCVAALLLLSPLMASAAVVGPYGHLEQQHRRPDTELPALSAAAAAATATRHKRWSTTFGSTQSKNISVPAAIRECSTDSDCLDTHYTSCAVDSTDRKRRCLCADGKQPSNGECLKKPRALRSSCETDLECLPNAICLQNGTASNPRLKICTCKDGFIEENEACNYASLLTFNYAAILVTVLASWFWNERLP